VNCGVKMTAKKIIIVSQHFPPEIGAASNRIEHLTRHFTKLGHDVFIVTSQPVYPNRNLYERQASRVKEKGYSLYRVPSINLGNGVLARLGQWILFLLMASFLTLFLAYRYRIKNCITTSPPFSVNFIGWLFRFTGWKRKWIMEVRDLWPDSITAVGMLNNRHLLIRLLRMLESHFYRVASMIVVVTPHTKRILEERRIPNNKISVITNGIPDWVNEMKSCKSKRPFPETEFLILYAGNLGKSQNLTLLLDVAELMPQFKFIIIGDGLEKNMLIDYAEKKHLHNVTFMDAILDKRELAKWYSYADIGVISLIEASLFEHVIPSKLFEYAAFELPVLYIGKGEGAELVSLYRLGRVANPIKEEIFNEIARMYDNINKYRENNAERNRFAAHYQWSNLAKYYSELI